MRHFEGKIEREREIQKGNENTDDEKEWRMKE